MWFLPAFATALFQALLDISAKQVKEVSGLVLCWAYCYGTSLLLLPGLLYFGIPEIHPQFWPALAANGVLNGTAFTLYFTAIQSSDLSLTVPMQTFTPMFMLLTSPLLVHEFPGTWGIAGIFLIVTGSYLLNLREWSKGLFAPFRALLREPGPRLMLLVAVIWSFSGNIDKIGIENSSKLFWLVTQFGLIGILLTFVVAFREGRKAFRIFRAGYAPWLVAVFQASGAVCQMTALTMTIVPYVISIKRLSVIFGVILGSLLFKEPGLKARLPAAALMCAGVFLITLM